MRTDGVVVAPPGFDEESSCHENVEDLPIIRELVAQPRIEALDVPMNAMHSCLPGRPGRDEAVLAPTAAIHYRNAPATNSGCLSERM